MNHNHLPSQEIPSAMIVYPDKHEHTTFPSTTLQMCLQGPLSIPSKIAKYVSIHNTDQLKLQNSRSSHTLPSQTMGSAVCKQSVQAALITACNPPITQKHTCANPTSIGHFTLHSCAGYLKLNSRCVITLKSEYSLKLPPRVSPDNFSGSCQR